MGDMTKETPPEEHFLHQVGERIKEEKLSIEALAKRVGMPASTLRYQLVRPATISLRNACKLRDSLGVNL